MNPRRWIEIDRSGSGRFVGLFEELSDGRACLIESHNAIEGPFLFVDVLADEIFESGHGSILNGSFAGGPAGEITFRRTRGSRGRCRVRSGNPSPS